MKYFSADYVLPITGDPIKNGVIGIDEQKRITVLGSVEDLSSVDIEHHRGIIIPGFINTHCHLELSHMKGLCQTGTKLIPFISDVVKHRDFEMEVIKENIRLQDEKMFKNGIQAVGDISNKIDTAEQKSKSPIAYYSFIEMFDFMQNQLTVSTIENYRAVYKDQDASGNNKKSFVPHAPYSVSPELFDFINKANPEKATISIHNQETADENQLFNDGSGGFKKFVAGFGFSLEDFKPLGKSSIYYTLMHLSPKKRNLFVHNTLTEIEDIEATHNWSENTYWATCPNANLYIENRLPNYQNFVSTNAKMCIGTDSIMSNWSLSIWEEIKTIKKHQSYLSLEELLKWGTINGAHALGYDKTMGSLEVGKSPGLINLDLDWNEENIQLENVKLKRLI